MNPILIPFALGGGVSEGAGLMLERKVLKKGKIDFRDYHVYSFLLITLLMLPLLFFFWKMTPEAFSIKNLSLLFLIIFFSVVANLLNFYAIKWEKLTEIEPLRLFQPLFVILLAFALFVSERQISKGIFIAATIASLALIFSHLKKHHLIFNKYAIAILISAFLFALELVLTNTILPYYNALTFYFIRCFLIFIVSLVIFKSKPQSIDSKSWLLMALTGGLWVVYRIFLYFGYVRYGIIFTTLLFILSSVFVYIFASIFLKEKLKLKNIIATIIILACIVYAIINS